MYVDLSVTLNEQTPVYPGDPAIKVTPASTLDTSGCNDHHLAFGNHTGTHLDAPSHMIAGGKTLDQFPIGTFIGHGVLVNVAEDFSLKDLEEANIQANDIVLFNTGMSKHYHDPVYFETYPVMSTEIARYLVKRKVNIVGIDACSVDNINTFPIHKTLLTNDILIIENLTNLNQLIGKEFTIHALPIKLNVDGAPARVVAEVTTTLPFEDFTKLDIRIGTVESVERVPDADKLLKFVFDVGTEKRQIMASMATFFDNPQELIGKQMPLLLNIEPRKFRGHESQGMIIAADHENKPVFLTPEKPMPSGSKVK